MNNTIIISLILISIYIFLYTNQQKLVYMETNTGTKFLVQKNSINNGSSNLLGTLVENMYRLRNYLIKNKKNYSDYEQYINLLEENFNEERTIIYETDPDSELTSYSVNKGEELSFCLKSKKTGKYHDINLLMYVAIHEMAHIACPEVGHGDLFKKIFKFLTLEAIKIGIYYKVDYSSNPVEYCGMILSSSIV